MDMDKINKNLNSSEWKKDNVELIQKKVIDEPV